MANILEVNRPNNKITLGTTGTTINIASHTASKLLSLDASKNLSSDSSLLTPTFAGLHINSAEVDSVTLLTLESDISNTNEYNEILFKIAGGKNYGAIRSHVGGTGDSYMSFYTTTNSGSTLTRQVTIQHNGKVGFGTYNPETLLEMVSTAPYVTLHNITEEDTDGSRESRINFKGQQSGGEETTLARIEVGHDGSADDQKGKLIISINDGDDSNTPTQALEIGSDLLATFAGSIVSANYTAANLLTACATNAGELDFTAASKKLDVEDNAVVSQDYSTDGIPQFAKLGINVVAPPEGLLKVYDTTVSSTLTYRGIENLHIKTAGTSDVNDSFYGMDNYTGYNQNGNVLGNTWGLFNYFLLTDGDIGDGSNVRFLYTNYNLTQLMGGKIYGNVYGSYTGILQEAGNEVTVDIYGHYITTDADGTVGGSVYGLYLNEGDNVDYGIYQNGTAPNVLGGSLDVGDAISSATLTFSTTGPTDNIDVSGVNTLFVDTSSNSVTIGGFAGGVDGQVLYVVRTSNANNVIVEHDEAGATQKILLHAGADETLGTEYGGWIFICHGGTDWHDCSHAKHVP